MTKQERETVSDCVRVVRHAIRNGCCIFSSDILPFCGLPMLAGLMPTLTYEECHTFMLPLLAALLEDQRQTRCFRCYAKLLCFAEIFCTQADAEMAAKYAAKYAAHLASPSESEWKDVAKDRDYRQEVTQAIECWAELVRDFPDLQASERDRIHCNALKIQSSELANKPMDGD